MEAPHKCAAGDGGVVEPARASQSLPVPSDPHALSVGSGQARSRGSIGLMGGNEHSDAQSLMLDVMLQDSLWLDEHQQGSMSVGRLRAAAQKIETIEDEEKARVEQDVDAGGEFANKIIVTERDVMEHIRSTAHAEKSHDLNVSLCEGQSLEDLPGSEFIRGTKSCASAATARLLMQAHADVDEDTPAYNTWKRLACSPKQVVGNKSPIAVEVLPRITKSNARQGLILGRTQSGRHIWSMDEDKSYSYMNEIDERLEMTTDKLATWDGGSNTSPLVAVVSAHVRKRRHSNSSNDLTSHSSGEGPPSRCEFSFDHDDLSTFDEILSSTLTEHSACIMPSSLVAVDKFWSPLGAACRGIVSPLGGVSGGGGAASASSSSSRGIWSPLGNACRGPARLHGLKSPLSASGRPVTALPIVTERHKKSNHD